jgi:hypothetical protein
MLQLLHLLLINHILQPILNQLLRPTLSQLLLLILNKPQPIILLLLLPMINLLTVPLKVQQDNTTTTFQSRKPKKKAPQSKICLKKIKKL